MTLLFFHWDLFSGVPLPCRVVLWVALTAVVLSNLSTVILLVNARRYRQDSSLPKVSDTEAAFLWVFIIPALNEELTIRESITRLRHTHATHKVMIVVNDGSDDSTGQILDSMAGEDLIVVTRTLPDARKGKAAGLNAAYKRLVNNILPARFPHWDPARVLVTIIDADGRLDPSAPEHVAARFRRPAIGGVQTRVRIYNRDSLLTHAQDLEFAIFGTVFQDGRALWGRANMGGNGQVNRLCALTSVADDTGPWRDKLTEDQDLGVRLIQAGWAGAQANDTWVEQQGLHELRRLYRQRTRWAQGSWQAFALLRGVARGGGPLVARLETAVYLVTPVLQVLAGAGLAATAVAFLFFHAPVIPASIDAVIFFVCIGIGPSVATMADVYRSDPHKVRRIVTVTLPYIVYTWLIFPAILNGLARQALGIRSWAKTRREADGTGRRGRSPLRHLAAQAGDG